MTVHKIYPRLLNLTKLLTQSFSESDTGHHIVTVAAVSQSRQSTHLCSDGRRITCSCVPRELRAASSKIKDHMLRTFDETATYWNMQGVSMKAARDVLSHSNIGACFLATQALQNKETQPFSATFQERESLCSYPQSLKCISRVCNRL